MSPCVVATAVNADGHQRVILRVDMLTTEDGAGWTAFLCDLVACGLSGVELVISDAHAGLKEAIAAVLPRGELAAVPDPFHAGSAVSGAQVGPGAGRHPGSVDLCSAGRGLDLDPAGQGRGPARRAVPGRRRAAEQWRGATWASSR
jgi:hypothetical protein